MTLDDVKKRVAEIGAIAADDETAHTLEDELHQDVLREVAERGGALAELATEALKTLEIDFARWCA